MTVKVSSHNKRILAVDDEPILLESIKRLLEFRGFHVDAVTTGKEAIEKLAQSTFDLLLLNLWLKDTNGFYILNHMVAKNINIPVIIISGDHSTDSAKKSLLHGASDFVRKPYEPEELLTSIEQALKKTLLPKHDINAMNSRKVATNTQTLYQCVVNNSPDIIFILNPEGCFTFVNSRVEFILGYTKDELVGRHFTFIVVEEDVHAAENSLQIQGLSEGETQTVELRLKRKPKRPEDALVEHQECIFAELTSLGIFDESNTTESRLIGIYGVIRDVSERKNTERLIAYQAYHDLLTGLPNRKLFADHLQLAISQARRNNSQLAVMFLDLDGFKMVNDTLGHVIGDELLRAVSQRLRGGLRRSDTLGRIGGDEFLLLLPQVSDKAKAACVAEKLAQEVEKPFRINELELFVSVSLGISLYPSDATESEVLVQKADIAMYYAKANKKGGFQFFDSGMEEKFSRNRRLERKLRQALAANQFSLVYQPQINTSTGQVSVIEALIRWNHPESGEIIPPSDFIPQAENTGLIIPIGMWMLQAVCMQIKKWLHQDLPAFRVAVNVSSVELVQRDFVSSVSRVLEEQGLPGEYLEFEITENGIMRDVQGIGNKLQLLRNQGITIAIDDFGTGYSSLSYLQKLPIQKLKIDRSFIQHEETRESNEAIVNTIVAMAKNLQLDLVAEGVETESQRDYLTTLGCNKIQGFIYSEPVSPDDACRLLTPSSARN